MTDSDELKEKLESGLLDRGLSGELKVPLQLTRRTLLPGIESGRYEEQPAYDKAELRAHIAEELARRDNRISIRVSGKDLGELQKQALAEGIPTQSLLANIIHQYVQGELVKISGDSRPLIGHKPVAEVSVTDSAAKK